MKKLFTAVALSLSWAVYGQSQTVIGFSEAGAKQERNIEQKYDSKLAATHLDGWMKHLAARPHHLGSPYDKANAEFLRDLFTSWGYGAKLEVYKVLFPTPRSRALELLTPKKFVARLAEPALKQDATSGQVNEQLPVYNGYSGDGDVTGLLVYVNRGVPEDYKELEKHGIDVKGKIVIARYGGSWRGIKPKVAQEHGAIGCLIFSDPRDDGYYQGDVYPLGAYKNQFGAQRGSVIDMPVYPGDPLTPGIGATENARRLDRSEAITLLKIPVLPISYSDAQPLLASLTGPVVPEAWRGALPLTYHFGPSSAPVHLKAQFDWKLVNCYNVIATLKGNELPDEWVVRGNHHDAWVNGANDPISGLVAELEEARVVGELVKEGWKPKRTIIYCAWDGEEEGLLGSTEWVEDHAAELQQKAIVYINSDGNGRGFLGVEGAASLETLMDQIAKDVTDPQTAVSVFERLKSHQAVSAADTKGKKEALANETLKIGAMGSGSDYSSFMHHLGIPSLNIGYGGEDGGGEYHSIYDSYDHYKRFKDPDFAYGVALAKTAGRATLRMANAESLPYDFSAFQIKISGYVTELIVLLNNQRETSNIENQIIRENRIQLAADPVDHLKFKEQIREVPYLDFSGLQNAVDQLNQVVQAYQVSPQATSSAASDHLLAKAEQSLLSDAGLPGRPWYRHTICAPGLYTGYSVKTLPGVREAIEQRNYLQAQEQITTLTAALNRYAAEIAAAARMKLSDSKK